jgi:hypothetical protein
MQLAREWEEQEQCRVENQRQYPHEDWKQQPLPKNTGLAREALEFHYTTTELIAELRRRGTEVHTNLESGVIIIKGLNHASTTSQK